MVGFFLFLALWRHCVALDPPPPPHKTDLLPLVIVAMVVGYIDKDNWFASPSLKFAIAIGSIIPLSYYIGMGIARFVLEEIKTHLC